MTTLTEGRHPVAFILSEGPGQISRDAVTIGASQDIEPGQLLGKRVIVAAADAVASAKSGNTGNATIAVGSPKVTTKVKHGRYKGIAVTATTVRWEDPNGKEVGTSTHGSAFAKGGINLTITAGGSASAAGDEFYFDVTLEGQDIEHVAYDPTATDGSEVAVAIAMYPAKTGAGEAVRISAFTRQGEVNGHELVLPSGATPEVLAAAYAELAAVGIIVRN